MRNRRRRIIVAAVIVAGVIGVAASALAVSAAIDLRDARADLETAKSQTRDLEFADATRSLDDAAARISRARNRLGFFPIRLAARVPYAGRSVRAVDLIAEAADQVVRGAREAISVSDALPDKDEFRLQNGRFPAVDWEAVERSSRNAADAFARADRLAREAPDTLVPGLILEARDELLTEVADAQRTAERLALGARALPGMLGERGIRRHLFVVQNLAETRATGGAIESVMLLRTDEGAFDLVRADTDEDVLGLPGDRAAGHLLNLEPHWPDAAGAVAQRYRETTGIRADTVIALDAHAIAAVLAVTGGVTADGHRLDADNALEFLSRTIFEHYPSEEAQSVFLGRVTGETWGRLRDGRFSVPDMLERLGGAAGDKHVLLWSRHAEEQEVLEALGVAGTFPAQPLGAALLAVTSNQPTTAEMDAYAQREIRYRVSLAADGTADASVTVTLEHLGGRIPSPVLSKNGDARLRSDITVWGVGSPETFRLTVPPERAREREIVGTLSTTPGEFRLLVHAQPVIRPDRLEIEITLPPGAAVVRAPDGFVLEGGALRWSGELRGDQDWTITYG